MSSFEHCLDVIDISGMLTISSCLECYSICLPVSTQKYHSYTSLVIFQRHFTLLFLISYPHGRSLKNSYDLENVPIESFQVFDIDNAKKYNGERPLQDVS